MGKIYVGDKGTEIILDTGIDLTTATLVKILAIKPSQTTALWTATVYDTTKIKYTTSQADEGDWTETGTWKLQAYVELPVWKGHGETVQVTVYALGK
jgi:hypothetical protein